MTENETVLVTMLVAQVSVGMGFALLAGVFWGRARRAEANAQHWRMGYEMLKEMVQGVPADDR